MSRNSKMSRKNEAAKQTKRAQFDKFSHKAVPTAFVGPKQTTPKHGKKKSKWQLMKVGLTPAAKKTTAEDE